MGKQLKPWAVALGCLLALAACTEPSASPQTVGPVATSPVVSTSRKPIITSTTTTAPTKPAGTGSMPSQSNPVKESEYLAQSNVTIIIPSQFDDGDRALAEAATANFDIAFDVADAAFAAPADKDWATELARYWAGSALDKQLTGTAGFKKDGWYTIGTTRVDGEVVFVSESVVNVRACVDDSAVDILDQEGNSRIDRSAELPTIVLYSATNYPGQGWLIDSLEAPDPEQIC